MLKPTTKTLMTRIATIKRDCLGSKPRRSDRNQLAGLYRLHRRMGGCLV